jgi:hypothetical protein
METLLTLKHLYKLQRQPKAVKESIGGMTSFREAMAIMQQNRRYDNEGDLIAILPDVEILNNINAYLTPEQRKEVIELL